MEEVEGIIISTACYSETSKILNILTKKYGLIGVLAKGARSLKSPLRSFTDRLSYANFMIKYKEDKLSILTEVNIINPFKEIRKDINKISYSTYLLELAEGVCRQNNSTDVYDLLIATLKKIEEGFDPLILMNILELKYLDYLGVMPVIDKCTSCGRKNGIVTLSSFRGGYVCQNCYKGEFIVSDKTIKLVRMFCYVDISKISKLDISKNSKIEINNFLDDYYDRYTGLYLKSKNFIRNLQKIS